MQAPSSVDGAAAPHAAAGGAAPSPRFSWTVLVAASTGILVLVGVALAVGHALTSTTRVTSYAVRGTPNRVELDLAGASAEVVGRGAGSLGVRRTERFSFGHEVDERRSAAGGVVRLRSRCPRVVAGRCSASYRLTVPDNVAVVVRTSRGAVRLAAFRGSAQVLTGSGGVTVDAFCGFSLAVKTVSGDARAGAACSPQRLDLRSKSGDLEADVPPGTYRAEADSNSGRRRVMDLDASGDAPFEIRALSDSGDVTVRGAG